MIKYENETYLDTNEASKFLGKTTTAFRQFIARNTLARRKLGGRLYFPIKELDGFFAKEARLKHFESSNLSFDDVVTVDHIQKNLILTTTQNIYYFVRKHNITRYKDNANRTLFNKAELNSLLSGLKSDVDDL